MQIEFSSANDSPSEKNFARFAYDLTSPRMQNKFNLRKFGQVKKYLHYSVGISSTAQLESLKVLIAFFAHCHD